MTVFPNQVHNVYKNFPVRMWAPAENKNALIPIL